MLNTFINKSNHIHNNKYDYSLIKYKNNRTKVQIICPEHGIFEQIPYNHSIGRGCNQCAIDNKPQYKPKDNQIFINECEKIHNNFYLYDKVLYKSNKIKIIVSCPEHGDFHITPSHHLNGVRCTKCSNNYRYTNDYFIEKSNKIHNDKYDYSLVKYINNITKIQIICPKHGIFNQIPKSHLKGHGCQKCKISKGELKIKEILEQNNIKFETQKRFSECKYKKTLPFDFYLTEQNILIEYDGEQHTKPIYGNKNFMDTIRNDNIKNNYCIDKNIQLIRIPYNDFNNIENIIKTIKNNK